MSTPFFTNGCKSAKEADAADRAGRYSEAGELYIKALAHLRLALMYEPDEDGKRVISVHTKAYMQRVACLQELCTNETRDPVPQRTNAPLLKRHESTTTASSTVVACTEREQLCEEMEREGRVKAPPVKFSDVVGLETVKELLRMNVVLPRTRPDLFTGNRHAIRSLLLYGPSGVGKTHIVRALANECEMAFFSFSAAQLQGMYVGESEKHIQAIFDVARRNRPCILFLDEMDALASSRESAHASGGHGAKLTTQLLVEMDGLSQDLQDVLIVATSNLPWDMDTAILSRFARQLYIPLPSAYDRYEMLRHHLSQNADDVGEPPEKMALLDLASRLELYSGRDMAKLIDVAYQDTLRSVVNARHFRRLTRSDGLAVEVPCAGDDEGARQLTLNQLGDSTIGMLHPTLQQLEQARASVKPAVNLVQLEQFKQWTQEHGEQSIV